jgi:hypothetical protein
VPADAPTLAVLAERAFLMSLGLIAAVAVGVLLLDILYLLAYALFFTRESERASRRPRARPIAALALVPLLMGCGTPRMLDLQGRPIEHPAMTVAGPGVWGVVDTAGGSLRAVLEFDIEVPAPAAVEVTGPRVALSRPPVFATGPRAIEIGAVICPRAGPAHRGNPDRPYVVHAGRATACFLLVRAEFPLDGMPNPAAPLVLTVDGRDLALAVTRVSPPPVAQR